VGLPYARGQNPESLSERGVVNEALNGSANAVISSQRTGLHDYV
jgi:hypothetical protein